VAAELVAQAHDEQFRTLYAIHTPEISHPKLAKLLT
jgi:hypothetical protein